MKILRKATTIYLSDEERALLETRAAQLQMTRNAYIRLLLRLDTDTAADSRIEIPKKQRTPEYA